MSVESGTAPLMVETAGLWKSYGSFVAVRDLSLEIPTGEVFGFLGPNGAGKTTTLKMLTGLLKPSGGWVKIGGHDMALEPLACKRLLSFIPDRPYVYEKLTAVEFMRFTAGLRRLDAAVTGRRIEELLSLFDLAPWGGRLIENYSHGMKQRLVVATALLSQPRLLVVDEPMVGLDPRGARLIKEIFRRVCDDAGMTVFLSTHSLEVAEELCDRVAIMNRGDVVGLGTLTELRARLASSTTMGLEEIFLQITAEDGEDPEAALDGLIAGQRRS